MTASMVLTCYRAGCCPYAIFSSEQRSDCRDRAMSDIRDSMTAASDFLSQHTPLASGDELWGSPAYPQPLRLTWYRTDESPPLALVTSVRAIIFQGDEVLVVREP